MEVLRTFEELRQWRARRGGRRIGFVPTMGALHAGHAVLLREMAQDVTVDERVLSIFVNPTQFGPHEDLAKYPRTLDADLALARGEGVTMVWHPEANEMYARGASSFVEESVVSRGLCGEFRPGHFRGVATVVVKLFNQVGATRAWFGLKDVQQFFVLKRVVRDLDVSVELIGVPTVREADGLAMSSRNRYLSPDERARAPELYRRLRLAEAALLDGRGVAEVLDEAKRGLSEAGFRIQYLTLAELPDLSVAKEYLRERSYALAAAVFMGETRLIDNLIVG